MLLFLGFALLAGAAFFVAEYATFPARERSDSLQRASNYGRFRRRATEQRPQFRERVLAPAADSVAGFVLKLNPKTTVESVRVKLLAAGLSDRISVNAFLAAKGVLAVVGLVFGALFGVPAGPGMALVLMVGGPLGGFVFPDFALSMRARARREKVRAELPDALDLLAVSVEAGLGFDGAIAKLAEHMDGALTEEFNLALGEMRIGESRQEALKKMAQRVDTPEVSTFTRAIIQADQLGISLGRILRVQAADTRLKRQAAAEEKAMKAPIKMLFPLVLFIFPAMFVVILGPALLNLKGLFV
ncbi:MAG TPA: type II secretion system F family protein [Gaiellaceae bacterium]|jgi:tight adherence protein C|nr:type II secretion system F family protein [Gaiellaceae bacterium]